MKVYLVIHENTNIVYGGFDSKEKAEKYISASTKGFRVKEIEIL